MTIHRGGGTDVAWGDVQGRQSRKNGIAEAAVTGLAEPLLSAMPLLLALLIFTVEPWRIPGLDKICFFLWGAYNVASAYRRTEMDRSRFAWRDFAYRAGAFVFLLQATLAWMAVSSNTLAIVVSYVPGGIELIWTITVSLAIYVNLPDLRYRRLHRVAVHVLVNSIVTLLLMPVDYMYPASFLMLLGSEVLGS